MELDSLPLDAIIVYLVSRREGWRVEIHYRPESIIILFSAIIERERDIEKQITEGQKRERERAGE